MYLDLYSVTDLWKIYKSASGTHLGSIMNYELTIGSRVLSRKYAQVHKWSLIEICMETHAYCPVTTTILVRMQLWALQLKENSRFWKFFTGYYDDQSLRNESFKTWYYCCFYWNKRMLKTDSS